MGAMKEYKWSPYKSVQDNVLLFCYYSRPNPVKARDFESILGDSNGVYHSIFRALEELVKKGKLKKVGPGTFCPK